jgi:hypothetical protein
VRARYYEAGSWKDEFYSVPVADAVRNTVKWRNSWGINRISEEDIFVEARSGKAYVNGHDNNGRSVFYYRLGREETMNPEAHLKLLVCCVIKQRSMSLTKSRL